MSGQREVGGCHAGPECAGRRRSTRAREAYIEDELRPFFRDRRRVGPNAAHHRCDRELAVQVKPEDRDWQISLEFGGERYRDRPQFARLRGAKLSHSAASIMGSGASGN